MGNFGRKIDNQSIYKYKEILTKDEFQQIKEKTSLFNKKIGYKLEWDEIKY